MDSTGTGPAADVVVVGGGITGLGVLWELSLRGIRATLIERHFPGAGTSGRFHGLLHSGARYAVNDPAVAAECARENPILRRLAPWCIDARWGLFVRLPEDDPAYERAWLEGCRRAGIPVRPVPVPLLARQEPSLEGVLAAYRVPDASLDGFNLLEALRLDACRRGAQVLTGTAVVGMEVVRGRVTSLMVKGPGGVRELHPRVVVNAAGPWAGPVAAMAGVDVPLALQQGSLVVYPHRILAGVLNRLRPPGDGDILVPSASTLLAGTTAVTVPSGAAEHPSPTPDEIAAVRREAEKLVPLLRDVRVLRVYAGVRSLLPPAQTRDSASAREVSRDFAIIDHSKDGVRGLITVAGGKFTTFRSMARRVGDAVAALLGAGRQPSARAVLPPPPWWGRRAGPRDPVICDCEQISAAQVVAAWDPDQGLDGLRRRLRLGMGACQGALCSLRAAEVLVERGLLDADAAAEELTRFRRERWRGLAPLEPAGVSAEALSFFRGITGVAVAEETGDGL